jgi:hypothetical protein
VLSHCLLKKGRDLAAAERVLRKVRELDPGNAEAPKNLPLLLQQREVEVKKHSSQVGTSVRVW